MKAQQNNQSIQNFINKQHLCKGQNKSLFICINKTCKNTSYLICANQQCKCQQQHFDCEFKKLKAFIKNLQQRNINSIVKIQQKINQITDKIIDKISQQRDLLLSKLKQEDNTVDIQQQSIKIFNNNKNNLSGSVFGQVWKSMQQSQKPQQKSLNQLKLLEELGNRFYDQNIKIFFQRIYKTLSKSSFCLSQWSQQLHSQSLKINQKVVYKQSTNGQYNYALFQKPLDQFKKNKIIWRIRVQSSGWVAVGICLRQFVKKINFSVPGWSNSDHGMYSICTNGAPWAYKDTTQNYNQTYARKFVFTKNDTIQMTYNQKQKILYFKKLETNEQATLRVSYNSQQSNDQYHICCVLQGNNEKIQLLQLRQQN